MMSVQATHATMTLDWSTNLTEIIPIDWTYADIKEFSDESVAILNSDDHPYQLLIFSKEGILLHNETFDYVDAWGTSFGGVGRDSSRFFIHSFGSGSLNLRIYEKNEGTYHSTNLVLSATSSHIAPTPNLRPRIGELKVEPAVPCSVFRRPTSRPSMMPSRSGARPRRGGPEGRGRSAATASLTIMF